jgi:two-component system, LytTR family, response regulator
MKYLVTSYKENTVWIKNTNGLIKINFSNILYAESYNVSVVFHLLHKVDNALKITSTLSIKEWEETLKNSCLFRVHNEYLLNLDYVEKYKIQPNGSAIVKLINGVEVPVSRSKKKNFEAKMNSYFNRDMPNSR